MARGFCFAWNQDIIPVSDMKTTDLFKFDPLRLMVAFAVTAFVVPFITYDTGVRCITTPCYEAAAKGSLIEFFAKAANLNAYIIDYTLFIVVFISLTIILESIAKFSEN